MIKIIILYYGLYILLLPYFIFWIVFIYSLLEIFVSRVFNLYVVIYFPEEHESMIINYLYVLPKRLVFCNVYNLNKKIFNFSNIKKIMFILLIVFLVGVSFIIIKILYYYLKYHDFYKVLCEIAPYKEYKIVIVDRMITRNMKKTITHAQETGALVRTKSTHSLLVSKRGKRWVTHAVAFSKEGGAGVLFTTKKQSVISESLIDLNNNYAYAQLFAENDFIVGDSIKNDELKNKLDMVGDLYMVKAQNKIIELYETNKQTYMNFNNIQTLTIVNSHQTKKCKSFIDECGGGERIENFINFEEDYLITEKTLKRLSKDLLNTVKLEERNKLINDNKELITKIKYLMSNNSPLSKIKKEKLEILNNTIKDFNWVDLGDLTK